MAKFNDIKIMSGLFHKKSGKEWIGMESLRACLNYLGQCCGVVCDNCGSLLRLPDQANTHTHTLYFKNDLLYTTINGVEYTVDITLVEEEGP